MVFLGVDEEMRARNIVFFMPSYYVFDIDIMCYLGYDRLKHRFTRKRVCFFMNARVYSRMITRS